MHNRHTDKRHHRYRNGLREHTKDGSGRPENEERRHVDRLRRPEQIHKNLVVSLSFYLRELGSQSEDTTNHHFCHTNSSSL